MCSGGVHVPKRIKAYGFGDDAIAHTGTLNDLAVRLPVVDGSKTGRAITNRATRILAGFKASCFLFLTPLPSWGGGPGGNFPSKIGGLGAGSGPGPVGQHTLRTLNVRWDSIL